MKIGINGYEAVVPRFGFDKKTGLPNRAGSNEVCFQMLKNINILDKKNNYFVYLPINPSLDMPKIGENWKYVVFKSRKLWTLIGLSKRLLSKSEKLDVFYSPTIYLPINFSNKFVISIHDVSYLHFPEMFNKKDLYKLKIWGRYSIWKSKKIVAVSESTKDDIIKKYGVPADKIEVIYSGIKPIENVKSLNMEELKTKFGISKDYILFVGTLQPRKNVEKLIEAFSKLKKEDLELVIVGKKGWMYEGILKAPEKFGVTSRVKFFHEISNEDLPSFYRHAKFFILPSLYEGFGLPILEAMQNGCPVITSNVSSLPEAGGDGALYFDPNDVEDMSNVMKKLLDDDKLRSDLIKKGHEQVKKFSWEKSARQTIEVLEKVGNNE